MLSAQGLWAKRHVHCATPAVTRGLSFSGLIQRIIQSPVTTHKGMWRIYYKPDPHGFRFKTIFYLLTRVLRYNTPITHRYATLLWKITLVAMPFTIRIGINALFCYDYTPIDFFEINNFLIIVNTTNEYNRWFILLGSIIICLHI
jgi:hypothetical protein